MRWMMSGRLSSALKMGLPSVAWGGEDSTITLMGGSDGTS